MWPFKKKQQQQPEPEPGIFLTARLNAKVQPIDRGEYFEDPLDEALSEAGLGAVTGGGTQLTDAPCGIEFCDLEISVPEADEVRVSFIAEKLETMGAPKGSALLNDDGDTLAEFGQIEGLALFLNGTDLEDSVYEACDVNHVIECCEELMGEAGNFRGHWQGNKETGLYFYGPRFEAMKSAITDFVAEYPLCQQSRIEQIA